MAGWRHERCIPAVKKEEIREQADQPEECQGDESAEHPNAASETREQQDTPGGSKISERTQGVLMANVAVCVGRWVPPTRAKHRHSPPLPFSETAPSQHECGLDAICYVV